MLLSDLRSWSNAHLSNEWNSACAAFYFGLVQRDWQPYQESSPEQMLISLQESNAHCKGNVWPAHGVWVLGLISSNSTKIITHKRSNKTIIGLRDFAATGRVFSFDCTILISLMKLWGRNTVIVPNINGNNCHKYLSQRNVFRHYLFTKSNVLKSNWKSMIWTIILMGVWSKNQDCTLFKTSSRCVQKVGTVPAV